MPHESEDTSPTRSVSSAARRTVVFVPAIAILGLILWYAVDVPYLDDWGIPGALLQDVGTTRNNVYHMLFGQSYEARNAFPRLIYLAVGLTIGWHVTLFMVLSWAFALVTFLALQRLLPDRGGRPLVSGATALLIGTLLFTSAQWKNWLWAIQMMQFVPPMCLALGLWIQLSRRSLPFKILACAVLNTLATFSPPNGMLCWVLGFPFLLIPFATWREIDRRARRWTLLWIGAYCLLAAAAIGFYFVGYVQPPGQPPLDTVLHDPVLGLRAFLAGVGAPFTGFPEEIVREVDVANAIPYGALVTALFAVALCIAAVRWRAVRRPAWPWICLAGYGIGTMAATAVGRAGKGIAEMLAPRYTTHALWLAIGLVGLGYVLFASSSRLNREGGQPPRRRIAAGSGFAVLAAAVAVLAVLSWIHPMAKIRAFSEQSRQNLLTVRLVHAVPADPMWRKVTWLEKLRQTARELIDRDILHIEPVGDWIAEQVQRPDPGAGGWFRTVGVTEKTTRFEGWAALPGSRRVAADCVLLARRTLDGKVAIVSGFVTGKRVPEGFPAEPGVPGCGFADTVDYSFALTGEPLAFAVDLAGRRVYRLERDVAGSSIVTRTLIDHLQQARIDEEQPDRVKRREFVFAVAGERRGVLFMHPDSDVEFPGIFVNPGAALEFGAGINELAWDQPGDGVLFEVHVVDEGSGTTRLYSNYLDPKNEPEHRRWFDERLDLGAFAGQEVTLRFSTRVGPENDASADWAGWSRPQIVYHNPVAAGISHLEFTGPVRIEHPLDDKQRLRLRFATPYAFARSEGIPPGTRLSSSDPKVIEVAPDGRLIPHKLGAVEVVATNGTARAIVRVEATWPAYIPYGPGSPGTGGIVPVLEPVGGDPRIGSGRFGLRVRSLVGGAEGALVAIDEPCGKSITAEPRTAIPEGAPYPLVAGGESGAAGGGNGVQEHVIPNDPQLRGKVVYVQGFFKDAGAKSGWSATNGLLVTFR